MKTAKLPLPVLILMASILFLFSSSIGEWIGRPSSAMRASSPQTVEQEPTAVVYVRAMSWLSQLINRPAGKVEAASAESAQTDGACPVSTHEMPAHRVQLCALSKPFRPSRGLCKAWQFTIQESPHSLTRLVTVQRTAEN